MRNPPRKYTEAEQEALWTGFRRETPNQNMAIGIVVFLMIAVPIAFMLWHVFRWLSFFG